MLPFRRDPPDEVTAQSDSDDSTLFDVQAAKKRRRVTTASRYGDLTYIPPTSNIVERLFSKTKRMQSDQRKSMLPENFHALAYLHCNRQWWSKATFAKVEKEVHEVEDEEVIVLG